MSQTKLHVQELALGTRTPSDAWVYVGECMLHEGEFSYYGFNPVFNSTIKAYALDFSYVGKEFAFKLNSEEKEQVFIGVVYDFYQSCTSSGQIAYQFKLKHLQDV